MTALDDIIAACIRHDGVAPVSDQARLEARRGARDVLGDARAIAVVSRTEPVEVELATLPRARREGHATRLLERIAAEHPAFDAWAHGALPGSTELAERFAMQRIRTLVQMRAPVPSRAVSDALPDGVRALEPGDEDAWLALNAAAFRDHPEQGSLTLADLADRRAEPWHDDANLLVLQGEGGFDAYAWVKPDPDHADVVELYALGVSPGAQGRGLGRTMLQAAFGRMRATGRPTAHLYVEGDNEPAIALYRSAGFARHAIDVRWRRDARAR